MASGSSFLHFLGRPATAWGVTAAIAIASGAVLYGARRGSARGETRAGERAIARAGGVEAVGIEPQSAALPSAPGAGELAKARAELESLRREVEKLRAEAAAIERAKAEAERARDEALKKLAAAAAGEAAPPEKPRRMSIVFGPHSDTPELAGADWREMAQAASNMIGLMKDVLAQRKPIEDAPRELQIQIAQENMKLAKFAIAASGKLPTNAPGNGEFTHPLVLANMLAEHLRLVGLSLSDGQLREIAGFGEEFDLDWERAQAAYGPETLAIEKVIDELELKRRFTTRMLAALSPEQRAVVAPPEIHDRFALDLYSPLLILIPYSHTVARETKGELEAAIGADLVPIVGEEAARALAEAWVADNAARLEPVAKEDVPFFTTDDALAAARATAKLRKALIAAPGVKDEAKANLREERRLSVPRIVKERGG
jgi:hypothetical protein